MRTKFLLTFILSAFVMTFSTSPAAAEDPFGDQDSNPAKVLEIQGQKSGGTRLMVVTDSPVTEEMREELRKFGTIHGVIDTYNIVALTLKGNSSQADVENLSFVVTVAIDQPLSFTIGPAGTWAKDAINAVDVQESVNPPTNLAEVNTAFIDVREVTETGQDVYVAIIDSGLPRNWRDFLEPDQVATEYALAFTGSNACEEKFEDTDKCEKGNGGNPTNQWERDTFGHGLAVAAHITGFDLNGLVHEGVAPDAKIIPLKVYRNDVGNVTIWESTIIAAIDYVKGLKNGPLASNPVVINISIAGPVAIPFTEMAIDDAITAGVIVVASAGNNGTGGMGYPGAYDQVISVGAVGWTKQFEDSVPPINQPNSNFFIFEDVTETKADLVNEVFVTDISSRELSGQHLDVLAPGENNISLFGAPQPTRTFVSGTSFAAPMVAGVAALILEANDGLTQGDVEDILINSALSIDPGSATVLTGSGTDTVDVSWGSDAIGAGLVQADDAIACADLSCVP